MPKKRNSKTPRTSGTGRGGSAAAAFTLPESNLPPEQQLPAALERQDSAAVAFALRNDAVIVPLLGGMVGGWIGLQSGLSIGGATVLATLAASASYIAAPAAMRVAIPEANTGMCVAAALGITFPFNLAIGIPLYAQWVRWLAPVS